MLGEHILYHLAKKFSASELAQTDEMKSALESDKSYAVYRLGLLDQITTAAKQFNVNIEGKIVLDLGCYDGSISGGYLDHGAKHVIGVDIDADAIAIAQAEHSNARVEFHLSAIDGIPLPDASVETIICFDVFEHVEKPADMLKEIHRILKPGGQILIGTWGWKHPFAPHLWSTMPVPWAHVLFSEKTMLRACRRVYESDWYSPTLHDLDENGNRKKGKYDHVEISTDYLNKYLVKDFEKVFKESDLEYTMHPLPFGSKYATWTKVLLNTPWVSEFVTGYLWAVLSKPHSSSDKSD